MAGMVNMNEIQAPEPDKQHFMISESDDANLERIRQHALGTMHALSEGKGLVDPEYAKWSVFVGEIEAEQRKRDRLAE